MAAGNSVQGACVGGSGQASAPQLEPRHCRPVSLRFPFIYVFERVREHVPERVGGGAEVISSGLHAECELEGARSHDPEIMT